MKKLSLIMGVLLSITFSSTVLAQSSQSLADEYGVLITPDTTVRDGTSVTGGGVAVSPNTSGVGGVTDTGVVAGVIGAGVVGGGVAAIVDSTVGNKVFEDAKNLSDTLTQTKAVGLADSVTELDKMSDLAALPGTTPQHDLRFGPTPTGDVFTFCMGPRPSKHSQWRYWWDYLCSHGQMGVDLE